MSIKTERLLSKAKKLAKKGENKQAKDIYSHILKNFPNNQIAKKEINLLGKDLHPTQVQLDEVMRFYATGDIKNALDYVE